MRGLRFALPFLTLTLAPLAAAVAAAAAAQTPGELERAKESFKAGVTAYAAGEYLAAIQAFESAYALTPLPPIAFSLAQAERRQYFVNRDRVHLDRAITLFRRYVEQVPSGGRRADALDALSQLEPLAVGRGTEGATPAAAARPTRLMITCDAPRAELSLDEGPAVPSPLIREVPPGPHRVAIRAPGFFPAQQVVTALVSELIPVTVALRERPSVLSVTAPRDADLFIDGTFAGRGGGTVRLDLASGPHRLVVAKNGHRLSSQTLELGRGDTRAVSVDLEPTAQRRASSRLLVAGALTLAAGAVLGGITLAHESGAKDFLKKREQGNVTAEERHAYEEDVVSRNRFRTATVVTLGASVGLVATALFLRELDNPEVQDLYRTPGSRDDARPPRPERAAAHLRLRVTPVLVAEGLGATVLGRF